MTDQLVVNDQVVDSLRDAMRRGEMGLQHVPGLIKRVIREEGWRDRVITRTGQRAQFRSFAEFVIADPLEGLGEDIDAIKKLCRDDKEALDLIDLATQNKVGRPVIGNIVTNRPEGNSAEKALRRLRKDRPDLHAQVVEGRLSAHRAMVEAGFRHRTATIPIDDPELTAAALIRTLGKRNLKKVVERLQTFL